MHLPVRRAEMLVSGGPFREDIAIPEDRRWRIREELGFWLNVAQRGVIDKRREGCEAFSLEAMETSFY